MHINHMALEGGFFNPISGPGGSASTRTLFKLNFIFTAYIETRSTLRKVRRNSSSSIWTRSAVTVKLIPSKEATLTICINRNKS